MAGCDHDTGSKPDAQVEALQAKAELDRTKKKLEATLKESAGKDDAVALAKVETEKAAKDVAEKDHQLAEKDTQIKSLEKDLADLKKGETFVYAEASKLHQQTMNASSLGRYQQFVNTFPTSPLVADANRAIAELSAAAPREARARAAALDPRSPERDFQQRFSNGFASLDEVAQAVKHRSKADVVRLLGAPNTTYRGGAELGYVDKVTDPANGTRGTLVVAFEEDEVSSVRVGYLGRPVRP